MPRLAGPRDPRALASIVYRSRACYQLTDDALLTLLERARIANAGIGVTGVLVYDGGYFFQCVEGAQAALTVAMNRIRKDPRHIELEILAHQEIPSRLFPAWHMNLARRRVQPPLDGDGLLLADEDALDALHRDRVGVQVALSALSVLAWQKRQPGPDADPTSSR